MQKVLSIDHLKELAKNEESIRQHFFIQLGGGIARSSKQILYDPQTNRFEVVNEIDFSFQFDLSEKQLANKTQIVEAIEAGALFKYE